MYNTRFFARIATHEVKSTNLTEHMTAIIIPPLTWNSFATEPAKHLIYAKPRDLRGIT